MPADIHIRELAAMLKAKRGTRSLRTLAQEISKEIGKVSASTLSRIEQGNVPDLDTFTALCRWLEVPMERLMGPPDIKLRKAASEVSTSEIIKAHLRADKTLDPSTAEALVQMIQLAYDSARRGSLRRPKRRR